MLRFSIVLRITFAVITGLSSACVYPFETTLRERVNVIVVDGTLTNLAEPQVVYMNRSKSDSLTGRFGTLPLTGATVEIVVDSSRVVGLRETEAGRYQAPDGFTGQIGHRYQLRFRLNDGTRYESNPEVMPAVPPISRVSAEFNPTSLPAQLYDGSINRYRGANVFYVDWQDPADQRNYYRWDWKLWEKQDWCRTCVQGYYFITSPINDSLYENCYRDNGVAGYFVEDYSCRTACWEIIRNFDLNLFDDQNSNGNRIQGRRVAQIPYLQNRGCLVEIRQSALTARAYQYYKRAQEQIQNNGGVADTPPTALVGNVRNVANAGEQLIGYFTASATAPMRYWLDRKQNTGNYPGLFEGLYGRKPSPEGLTIDPNTGQPKPNVSFRPTPTAVCVPSDSRTPFKPDGWQD